VRSIDFWATISPDLGTEFTLQIQSEIIFWWHTTSIIYQKNTNSAVHGMYYHIKIGINLQYDLKYVNWNCQSFFHTAIYFALQHFDFERTGGRLSQKTCIVSCIRYLHFYLYKYWYDSYTRKQQHKRKRLTKLRITARTKLFTKLCTKYIIDKAELHQHMLILISRFLLLIM
jgi:hypothetical protein